MDDSLQICSDSMATASKDIVSSNTVLCNDKEDEESICSGCSQCSEPICSDCCMDDLSLTPNVFEVTNCKFMQINSDALNASKDLKANNVVDKVEDTFDGLMELCQNLAELAQTKVDDINHGEVLSTNMLLGDMLWSAGKELKKAGEHLLKCSGDIREGHLRNIPRNHSCKSTAPPVQVNFTKTVNTLDPKVMQSLQNVCVDLSYTCYLCKKSFKFEGQLNDHLNGHIILQYPCHKCTKVSKSKCEHVKHLKTHENNYAGCMQEEISSAYFFVQSLEDPCSGSLL